MKPIKFPEWNVTMGIGQPEYDPLVAHRTPSGEVISCWRPSLVERLKVLFRGRIWLHVHTHNSPLQPVFLQADHPFCRPQ